MTHEEALKRYHEDSRFRNVVDMYYALLLKNQISYYEMYDALIFTSTKFALEKGMIINTSPYKGK